MRFGELLSIFPQKIKCYPLGVKLYLPLLLSVFSNVYTQERILDELRLERSKFHETLNQLEKLEDRLADLGTDSTRSCYDNSKHCPVKAG
ncbi:hypothetical protein VTO42DRAFT_2334 [Malbranchea cinnamomea]